MRKKNINATYVMKTLMQQRDLSNIKGHVMKVENIHVITEIKRKQQKKILTHIVNMNIRTNQNLYVNKRNRVTNIPS